MAALVDGVKDLKVADDAQAKADKAAAQAKSLIEAIEGHYPGAGALLTAGGAKTVITTVAVFGATGAQGGAVVDALLAAGAFDVVAVTRKPDGAAAKALAAKGGRVRVARGDLDDAASLPASLAGCDGVFLVTNYWEHGDEAREERQCRAALDACKAAGVQKLVFSALEDVAALNASGGFMFGTIPPLAGGGVVPHFDAKGRAMAYAKTLGLNAEYVKLSFYAENFTTFFPPRKNADGTFSIALPMGPNCGCSMGVVSVADVGPVVAHIFANPDEFRGLEWGIAGDVLTVEDIAAAFSRVFGQTVRYAPVELEAFKALGFPGAADLGNMFRFYQDAGRCIRSPADTRTMHAGVLDFEEWLTANKGHPKWKEVGLCD